MSFEKALFQEDKDVYLTGYPSLTLHLNKRTTYDVRYRLIFGPEREDRARNEKPSPRERSFKGLTSLFERSYITVHMDKMTLFFGREYTDWGPSPGGNLLISQTAGSFDQIGARASFQRFRWSVFHALLSAEFRRYLAGHRIEARFGKLHLGISETVVYADREFDPIYALPLASFYANQFGERGDDNVLWSVETKYAPVNGVLLYGSFLIDDFQFERAAGAPDKLAFDVGAKFGLLQPAPITVRMRYRYVDIYTYTHRDSMNAHLTGTGSVEQGDPLIGGTPGPDSDEWSADVSTFPRRDLTVTFHFLLRRLGEGNDFRNWIMPMESFPPFPSGTVERTMDLGVSVLWELGGNSNVSLGYNRAFVDNQTHLSGQNGNSYAFRLAVCWDL
jgi:hypothetical protein